MNELFGRIADPAGQTELTAEQAKRTRERLIEHCRAYPALMPQDLFKFLFQSSFGCEHLVTDESAALSMIWREYEAVFGSDEEKTVAASTKSVIPDLSEGALIQTLDGEYSRVSLQILQTGLKAGTLAKLFCLSARKEPEGEAALKRKIQVAKEMASEGLLPFEPAKFEEELEKWRVLGYPAVHHSEAFRLTYRPAYRVIASRYVAELPRLIETDKKTGDEGKTPDRF